MLILYYITQYTEVCNGFKTECITENGNDSVEHCLSDDSDTKCHSLNELSNILNNTNISVLFCSPAFNLDHNLILQGIHNVTFIGLPSVFTCSDGAGLTIVSSDNIFISNITLDHCGVLYNSTTVASNHWTIQFRSAMYIFKLTDITIEAVTISNSDGVGLTLFDTDGIVEITNCTFIDNRMNENDTEMISGGGGVYLHINITDSSYHFTRCKFVHNNATSVHHETDFAVSESTSFQGIGSGGGLNVVFRGGAICNNVTIYRCHFIDNSAIWGGGLKVTFQDQASENSFVANKSLFENNRCPSHAGGGADVGYSYFSSHFPCENGIEFSNCNFTNNKAKFGGGLAIYSSSGSQENLNNSIQLAGCRWSQNKARFGSAVDVSTHAWTTFVGGYLPSPRFKDSIFLENTVTHKIYPVSYTHLTLPTIYSV